MQSEKYSTIFKSIADFFGVLGNSDRLRILALILEKPRDVNEIHELLNISQPRTSQNLKLLKLHNILSEKKVGKHVYYSIKDTKVSELIEKVFELDVIENSRDKETIPVLNELIALWHSKIKHINEEDTQKDEKGESGNEN